MYLQQHTACKHDEVFTDKSCVSYWYELAVCVEVKEKVEIRVLRNGVTIHLRQSSGIVNVGTSPYNLTGVSRSTYRIKVIEKSLRKVILFTFESC